MLRGLFFVVLVATSYAVNLPGVPVEFSANDEVLSAVVDDVARKFEKEYISFLKTGIESPALRQISAQLATSYNKKDLFTKEIYELDRSSTFVVCLTCRATVNVMSRMFREDDGELNGPNSDKIAKKIMLDVCERLNIQTAEVCGGLFDSNWDTIQYIIKNSVIDSHSFCSLFMEMSFCNVKQPEYSWSLNIDNSAPAITGHKSNVPKKGENDLKVLHVTDIHYDPLYAPGSLAECDEPLCCQRHSDQATGNSKAAGYWGDYRDCDCPIHTIENAFNHIKNTHEKIDFIYQTGDIVDHMVWATSETKNNEVLTEINNKLTEVFPDVPVYPCIGNHEPHPLNVFSPEDVPDNISSKWLYKHLYSIWSKWLPASTEETILKGGYYTVAPRAGFRIVSLNNNDCYNKNWWLFHDGTNMMTQLQWLHDTLLAAERSGEYVHILAHIPSGDGSCWSVWSREYNRIIERFRDTVSGIFNGHTHKDEMNVHYSSKGYAYGISWNAGSLTTFSDKNPNYRMYQIETESMQVVDHETWLFNLTEANIGGKSQEPIWFKEYVFTEEFTSDLSPAGLDKLLDVMADTPELVRKFWRFKMTSADPKLMSGCGNECLLSTICRLSTTVNDQIARCNELKARLQKSLDNEFTTAAPTEAPTDTPTTKDGGDGAASISALKISSIIGFFILGKYLL